ncbi:type II toxin-antitoxin system PemK/MazF family toxin [Desulfitibacter alkalitolerans]|uniref:type II toxin-antitoxin system PemK/MazF family toxin n=1 Tax=Desulfitibacter alkalitolerans TaxID=264641 RepID=UPI000482E2DD|nr:type II toxin-antitoxin system PemK/MazF family toxin [Desulfitibacter alkalitolerans]
MSVYQGDIYWIDMGNQTGSKIAYRHPYVVIQNNVFNKSRMNTAVVCALTSNIQKAGIPGNVLLEKDEGNLPKQSVVNVSQITTVDKSELIDKIGTLSKKRIYQIIDGINLLIVPRG